MAIKFDHSQEFYRTSLVENAADYLVKLEEFYNKSKSNTTYWKWIMIALHGALYHFMLAALVRSDYSGIFKKELTDKNNLIDIMNPKLKLIDFLKAYEYIKDPSKMKKYIHSKPFIPQLSNDEAMKELNNVFRNQFIHYKPFNWSIEIEKMKEVKNNTFAILEFLINDSGSIVWYDDNMPGEVRKILNNIR